MPSRGMRHSVCIRTGGGRGGGIWTSGMQLLTGAIIYISVRAINRDEYESDASLLHRGRYFYNWSNCTKVTDDSLEDSHRERAAVSAAVCSTRNPETALPLWRETRIARAFASRNFALNQPFIPLLSRRLCIINNKEKCKCDQTRNFRVDFSHYPDTIIFNVAQACPADLGEPGS